MPTASASPHVLHDVARMWRYAREHGLAAEIKRLHRPVIWRSLGAAICDWIIIFVALSMVVAWTPIASPLAIVIIGNRQRALGNLLHDAAHGSFGPNRRCADLIARCLLLWPMWNSLEIYRRDHFAHHRLLGVPGHDVDLIHSEESMGRSWLALLWRDVTNRRSWIGSALGHLLRAERPELALILAWWGAMLLAIALVAAPLAAIEFLLLWAAARATVFHWITTFREISDHVGLWPGTLIGFSRNHTGQGLFGVFIHPHCNGYHLAHHLNPGMPYFALPKAHALLMAWPEYARATHCSAYFFGETALVRSWVRANRPLRRSHRISFRRDIGVPKEA